MATTRKRSMRPGMLPLIVATLVGAMPAAAAAEGEPTATPYRPSVSTPAALSAPGWIEIETGLGHARAGGSRLDAAPVTVKLAFTPDWGIRIGGDAWQRHRDGSGRTSGIGDTGIVLKHRLAIDDARAFGLEAGVTLPTAHGHAGIGKPAWGVNAIYSADFGAWHTDLNLAFNRFGQREPGTSRMLWLWAAALSRSLDERWGVVGELSGAHQRGDGHSSQALLALSFAAMPRLTLDAGVARSLRSGPTTWSVFTGLTWTAARLF